MAEFSQYSIACVIGIPPLLRQDCGNRAVMNPHEGLGKRNPQQVAGEQFRFMFNMAKLALAARFEAMEKLRFFITVIHGETCSQQVIGSQGETCSP